MSKCCCRLTIKTEFFIMANVSFTTTHRLKFGGIPVLVTRQMPTASRGEPEIENWTFDVVTHIIIILSNMKLSYALVSRHVPSFLVWCVLFRSVSNLRRNLS